MRLRMVSHHASTHFCRPKYYKSEVEGHPRPSCLVESRLWEIIARKRSRAPIVRVVAHSENGHLSSFRSAITPVKSRLRKGQPLDRHLTFLNRNSARFKPIYR
jgi:hypothetical protein